MGDPMQLLRITGTKAKIHLDPAVAAAGDSKTTMSVSIGVLINTSRLFQHNSTHLYYGLSSLVVNDSHSKISSFLCHIRNMCILANCNAMAIYS